MGKLPSLWLKKLEDTLEETPLFGNSPPFDLEALEEALKKEWELESLHIRPLKWSLEKTLEKGLGTSLIWTPISTSIGPVYWLMPKAGRTKLLQALKGQHTPSTLFSSKSLQEGAYTFFLLQALQHIGELSPFQSLSLEMSSFSSPPDSALCADVEILFGEKGCLGRICVPKETWENWKTHFSSLLFTPSSTTLQNIPLSLSVSLGEISFDQKSLKALSAGDFIPLSKTGYDPKNLTGNCTLYLRQSPLFFGRRKQDHIEILDYAYEEKEPMEDDISSPEEGEKSLSLKELPLSISVEIARLEISLEKLMQLKAGNTLELSPSAGEKVTLRVQGKKIADAELMHLGETLGIRILDI